MDGIRDGFRTYWHDLDDHIDFEEAHQEWRLKPTAVELSIPVSSAAVWGGGGHASANTAEEICEYDAPTNIDVDASWSIRLRSNYATCANRSLMCAFLDNTTVQKKSICIR